MSASISLSHISWSTPDGRRLFSDLDLHFGPVRTGIVGRNGVGKTTLLRLAAGTLTPQGGSLRVEGRLGVLRQAVQPAPNETIADLFGAAETLALVDRAERGLAGTDDLSGVDWSLEARIGSALSRFGLDVGPDSALATLSGGQHTRAMLASLVFAAPDIVLLDEPTNNLDRDGRAAVLDLLANWRGGAVVVSHDREVLETMDAIVELTTLGATTYGGNWSHYRERKAIELASARHDLADAERRVTEVDRRAQATRERKDRKDHTGQRKRAKGDMPRIALNDRKNRSETTTGDHARLAARRREQAVADAVTARERIEILQPLSISLPPTSLAAAKIVLEARDLSGGYGSHMIIEDFSLTLSGPERVAVSGPNGSGKTTLLRLITGQLPPGSGNVRITGDFAMLDQQLHLLDPAASIRDNFRRLHADSDENTCRAALARFMFRADAALQTVSSLSGGQMLRAALACVLGGDRPPSLLVLDEPTNHLDIDAIETVEAGLNAYDGALLVVSHDEVFLNRIGISRRLHLGG